jgi:DNA-binding NtrC family response regulator
MKGVSSAGDAVLSGEHRVLILEDDSGLARGLKMVLSAEGCDVEVADTGYVALDLCVRKDFDVLVADLRLPDLDGMEIIRLLKEKRPGMKVLVITGYASIDTAVESFHCGASDYLSKPFTESDFKAALVSALEQKKEALPEQSGSGRKERLIQRREVVRILESGSLRFFLCRPFKKDPSGLMKTCRHFRKAPMNRGAAWNG